MWTGSLELAIQMMRDLYDIDMSKHSPRQVDALPLDMFDLIVAIDPADSWLRARFACHADRLQAWDILDPGIEKETPPEQIVTLIRDQILALPLGPGGRP